MACDQRGVGAGAEFTDGIIKAPAPLLLHYMGSSQHGPRLLLDGFEHRKPVLVDGSGNVWVWVGADMPVDEAVAWISAGAIRYNGQTCTSVNGAMIHPDRYAAVRDGLRERWSQLVAGDPRRTGVDVGPLFDEAQARWCVEKLVASGGNVLCGGSQDGGLPAANPGRASGTG